MIKQIEEVELTAEVIENRDLSGLVTVDDYFLIGSDEGHALQLFLREGSNQWRSQSSIQLADLKGCLYSLYLCHESPIRRFMSVGRKASKCNTLADRKRSPREKYLI